MGIELVRRKNKITYIEKSLIKSGVFVIILRLDGLAPIISYGTGSRATHCGVTMWIDNELYIIESRDGDYWPYHGI
jgi:hypothetical protein